MYIDAVKLRVGIHDHIYETRVRGVIFNSPQTIAKRNIENPIALFVYNHLIVHSSAFPPEDTIAKTGIKVRRQVAVVLFYEIRYLQYGFFVQDKCVGVGGYGAMGKTIISSISKDDVFSTVAYQAIVSGNTTLYAEYACIVNIIQNALVQ